MTRFLTAALLLGGAGALGGHCRQLLQEHLFDLSLLQAPSDYALFVPALNATLDFNFCKYVQRRCSGRAPAYYAVVHNNTDCFYARDALGNATQYELLRDEEEPGLRVTRWDARETGLTFTLDLLCARSVANLTLAQQRYDPSTQSLHAVYKAAGACPQQLSSTLWSALYALRWPLALIGLLLGPLELLLGYKLFRLTVFLLGFLLIFAGVLTGASLLLLRSDSSALYTYLVLLLSALPAVVGGYVLSLVAPLGVLVAGATGGLFGGLLLNYLLLWRVDTLPSWLGLYLLLSHCCLLGALLAHRLQDVVVIVATSFVGAYVTVRALSVPLGGFPNEFEINTSLQTGAVSALPYSLYIYLLLILGLFALGTALQLKWRPHRLEYVVNNAQLVNTLNRVNNFELPRHPVVSRKP